MAGLFGVIALVSLGFAIYVRLQPATVIRVSADGEATVVGGRPAELRSGGDESRSTERSGGACRRSGADGH